MALSQKGNRVYAKITDLSEESTIQDGDKILIHSSSTGNAAIIDWSNIRIDKEHTTFGSELSSVVEFTQSASAWVDAVTESFNDVEANVNNVKENLVKVNSQMEGVKMVIKMILGLCNNWDSGTYNKYLSGLDTEARETYDAIINEVFANQKDGRPISFLTANLMNFSDY